MASLRVLVTGATGFVGTRLTRAMAERDGTYQVVALGSRHMPSAPGVPGVDLLDRADIERAVAEARPDIVVHLAAQSSVAASQAVGFARTWQVNVEGTLNLALALARHAPRARLLFASSTEVYGDHGIAGGAVEETPLTPSTPYAKSKVVAERLLAAVLAPHAQILIARPCNHTGAGQSEAFVLPSFAAQIARIEAGLQEPVLRVGNLGVARDFLDVRDVVAAYVAIVEQHANLPQEGCFNIASSRPFELNALLDRLIQLSGVTVEVVPDAARFRTVDVASAHASSARLREATGWSARIGVDTMLRDLLAAARRSVRCAQPARLRSTGTR